MTVKINADTSDGLKLVSDTSGVIDFQSNGVTKMSMDASGNLTANSFVGASGTIVKIAADEITAESSGSGAFSNIGLEVSITPASASNKILLLTTGSVATNGTGFAMKFTQDGSDVGIGDAPSSNTNRPRVSFKGMSSNGNRSATFAGSTILSPNSTSALTYRVQIEIETQSTWYFNRAWHASNSSDTSHGVSASYLYAIELDGSNTTIST